MSTDYRKGFYYHGTRLFSWPLSFEQGDTQLAIVEFLAYKYKCAKDEIEVRLEECAPKQWDFSRDCVSEHLGKKNGNDCWRILNTTNGRLYKHVGPLASFVVKYEAGAA